MQTLKTAAIVVLMLSVIYGAYFSLTTPPEPLPDDVRNLVIDDRGTLAIDVSLPDSLNDLGIDTGEEASSLDGSTDMLAPPTPTEVTNNSVPPGNLQLPNNLAGVAPAPSAPPASQPEPQPALDLAATTTGISTTISDMVPSAPAAGSQYASTNHTFEIPDPASAATNFTRSPDDLDLPETEMVSTDLALAGGSESIAPGNQTSGEVSQVSLNSESNLGLSNAIRSADQQYTADQRKEALATLSIFYSTPNLTGEQRAELLSRLDPLAREVIYSQRHLLEQPHRVGQNETLMEIATRYEVPWQLLANINQIRDPVTILPGTELKVVRGPFRCEVDLTLKELTLFLGDLYAGRFPIEVGTAPTPKPGQFVVQSKQTKRTFYNTSGSAIPPGAPENPYGNLWLDLGGEICIHGSPSESSPTNKGCISLAAGYANDLYGILSQGSSVTIRR